MLLILFSIYGLGTWYGSKLILDHGYKSGDVISVMLSVAIGGSLSIDF